MDQHQPKKDSTATANGNGYHIPEEIRKILSERERLIWEALGEEEGWRGSMLLRLDETNGRVTEMDRKISSLRCADHLKAVEDVKQRLEKLEDRRRPPSGETAPRTPTSDKNLAITKAATEAIQKSVPEIAAQVAEEVTDRLDLDSLTPPPPALPPLPPAPAPLTIEQIWAGLRKMETDDKDARLRRLGAKVAIATGCLTLLGTGIAVVGYMSRMSARLDAQPQEIKAATQAAVAQAAPQAVVVLPTSTVDAGPAPLKKVAR